MATFWCLCRGNRPVRLCQHESSDFFQQLGKAAGLNDADRFRIAFLLVDGRTTIEISKIIGRDYKTNNAFVFFSGKLQEKHPKGRTWKKVLREMFVIWREKWQRTLILSVKPFSTQHLLQKWGKRLVVLYSNSSVGQNPIKGHFLPKNIKLSE